MGEGGCSGGGVLPGPAQVDRPTYGCAGEEFVLNLPPCRLLPLSNCSQLLPIKTLSDQQLALGAFSPPPPSLLPHPTVRLHKQSEEEGVRRVEGGQSGCLSCSVCVAACMDVHACARAASLCRKKV